ncbi:MAG: glycosyl transferase [Frankiales bacterium]|nr:glycosyl transferase [Frankiales bacterium]
MAEHRALVVTIPSAAGTETNGGSLRVADVVAVLEESGHAVDVVQRLPTSGRWCTGVAVSYASAGHVRGLQALTDRTWLDAMDSWLLVDGSGLRRGHLSYGARAVRDGARLLRMPDVDLATWISAADRRADGATVRAGRRAVLPGRTDAPPVQDSEGCRAVVVGDWGYPPNRDGLRWLLEHVLPLTTARVSVYGPGAPASARLDVRGYVADLTELYRRGDVHLGPVRFGGGVKRKVLQPLLAGLPVVSTSAGAHGLRPHPLLDVADQPAAFAAALDRRLAAPAVLAPPAPGTLLDADERVEVLRWLQACSTCS